MLVGMGLGMVIHLVIGLVLSPLLGAFHTMLPGSLIAYKDQALPQDRKDAVSGTVKVKRLPLPGLLAISS